MSVFDKPKPRLNKNAAVIAQVAEMTAAINFPDHEPYGHPTKEEVLVSRGLGLRSVYELPRHVAWNQPPPPPVEPKKTLLGSL